MRAPAIILIGLILPFFLWLSAIPARGGDLVGGLVYGKDHAFTLTAPRGWVLDNTSGQPDGLDAVFYPKGSSWESGDTVMYAAVAHKSMKGQETLDKVMQADAERSRKKSPGISITDAGTLPTGQAGKSAVARHFIGDAYGNHEAIAYIDEGTVVVLLVLTSRTGAGFEAALPALRELVKSYVFVTAKVNIQGRQQ